MTYVLLLVMASGHLHTKNFLVMQFDNRNVCEAVLAEMLKQKTQVYADESKCLEVEKK